MKIMDFLDEKAVCTNLKSTTKEDVIGELIDLLINAGDIRSKEREELIKILLNRESLGSTGIGQGIGIPHGKCEFVKKLVGALGISKNGINFDSLDGELVHIFFLLVAPVDSAGPHLKALARISKLLKDKFFRDSLRNAENEKALSKIIREEDLRR